MTDGSAATAGAPLKPAVDSSGTDPLWARLVVPSVADIIFIALFAMLSFGAWGPKLLGDADTGWHIRNGEHILRTLSVPRTDYFSYTLHGQPWYAWEWLYDALIAAIHHVAGLNGVVVFSALVIALTFTLLFRLSARRSGNVVLAAVLTLIAAAAATVHFLARPHVLTWLFALVWFSALDAYQRGERNHLYWLAASMLLWVNLHGGFLLGLMLLALFGAANLWTASIVSCPQRRGRARERLRHITVVALLSFAATFATPYGWRLYAHLREYLGSRFLMDHISEFQSPSFHSAQAKFFLALLVLTIVALVLGAAKVRVIDVVIVAFSLWMALFAARNIPIASILLTLTMAPLLGDALRGLPERNDITLRLRALATSFDGFAARMGAIEQRLNTHALAALVLLIAVAASLHHGTIFGRTLLDLRFSPQRMPVAGAEYLAANGIRDHFFSPDDWGGYLIYRFYDGNNSGGPPLSHAVGDRVGTVQLFMDDRHDFYGEAYVRDYLKVMQVGLGWRDVLDRYAVRYVLIPPDSPLANTLKLSPTWRVLYDDGTAIIFAR